MYSLINYIKRHQWLAILLYIISIYALYHILFLFGVIKEPLCSENLLKYDAAWYKSIVKNGYVFLSDKESNPAFYPIFPLIWKTLNATPLIISFINSIIMGIGVYVLSKKYNITGVNFLMLLTTPTLAFCFIPYSESIFFLSCALCLIGLKDNNYWLIFIGCLIAGLTRSVMVFFIPACIYLLIRYFKSSRKEKLSILILFSTTLLTFVIVTLWQYHETGVWFTFFKAQEFWAHYFRFPGELYSVSRESSWGDITGLSISLTLTVFLIYYLFQHLFTKQKVQQISPEVLFSILNIAGVGLFVLLFQGGDLHSLNRYIFCTPFFWIVAINIKEVSPRFINKLWIPILLIVFNLSSGGPLMKFIAANGNIFTMDFLKCLLFLVILLVFYMRWIYWTREKKFHTVITYLLIIWGFIYQLHLIHSYIEGKWIG